MKLTVLASGSAGNGYVLEGRTSALIIECGVRPERAFRQTGIQPSKVSGCLVSHEHGDHAEYMDRYARLGMPVFASAGTFMAKNLGSMPRAFSLKENRPAQVGEFYVMPFGVEHDAAEPLGFYISSDADGVRLLFMTDLRKVPFSRCIVPHAVMIEANWSSDILDGRVGRGEEDIQRAARIKDTHLSLEGACSFVREIDGPALQNVILLHLSDRNSDAAEFAARMRENVRLAAVNVAAAGLTVELNKDEFSI